MGGIGGTPPTKLPPPSGNPPVPLQPPAPQPAVVHVSVPEGQVDLLDPAVIAEEVKHGEEQNEEAQKRYKESHEGSN